MPSDFLGAALATGDNLLAGTPSTMWWMLRKRLSLFHHVPWYKLVPFILRLFRLGKPAIENVRRIHASLDLK